MMNVSSTIPHHSRGLPLFVLVLAATCLQCFAKSCPASLLCPARSSSLQAAGMEWVGCGRSRVIYKLERNSYRKSTAWFHKNIEALVQNRSLSPFLPFCSSRVCMQEACGYGRITLHHPYWKSAAIMSGVRGVIYSSPTVPELKIPRGNCCNPAAANRISIQPMSLMQKHIPTYVLFLT